MKDNAAWTILLTEESSILPHNFYQHLHSTLKISKPTLHLQSLLQGVVRGWGMKLVKKIHLLGNLVRQELPFFQKPMSLEIM